MILWPFCETSGVLILATLGAFIGQRAARAQAPLWLLGYLFPLALITAIAIPRWVPQLEFAVPFCWVMADRREFALLAFICSMILTTPLSRLPRKSEKVMVVLFMVVFITIYSILPFLLPGLNYRNLSNLKTNVDANGICLQSNDYDCGPAAAVTALRRLGLSAGEGELAILAHTTSLAGTPADSLCAAVNRRYERDGIQCVYRQFASVSELQGKEPVIAVVKYGFLVDHYVTVLAVTDTSIQVGDPLEGLRSLSYNQFTVKWRKCGIVVQRNTNTFQLAPVYKAEHQE